jgi:hypothetical protein
MSNIEVLMGDTRVPGDQGMRPKREAGHKKGLLAEFFKRGLTIVENYGNRELMLSIF